MDPNLRGARVTIVVEDPRNAAESADKPAASEEATALPEAGSFEAEVYVIPEPKIYRAPSDTYLGHITKGLRFFGYDDEVIAEVEAIAAGEAPD
jgi:hypothetical protein